MSIDRGLRPLQIPGYEYTPPSLLVNGGFELWQRGAGPAVISPSGFSFQADEWEANCGPSGGGTTTYQQSSSPYSGSYAADVNYTGTQRADLFQGIESYKSLEDLWLTFSVWVKTSASAVTVGISDYVSAQENSAVATHSGSGNWERLTAIKKVRTGLTSFGSWPHSFALIAWINTAGPAQFFADGATLVVGKFPEGVPFVPPQPANDFHSACRFYQRSPSQFAQGIYLMGEVTTGFTYFGNATFPVMMQSTPTMTLVNHSVSLFPGTTTSTGSNTRGVYQGQVASGTGKGYFSTTWHAEVT